MSKARWMIAGVVGLGVVAWLVVADRKSSGSQVSVRGKIVFIDAAAGTGTIEYPSPGTGETVEVTARIAENATITLNGRPAKLADLRPGDAAMVRAQITRHRDETGKSREITALSIAAERAEGGA